MLALATACATGPAVTEVPATDSIPAHKEFSGPVELQIISPEPMEVVKSSDIPVKFYLRNYDVQPNGQHIHLILDNEPYQPCYTVKEPCVIKNVSPGIHTLRAFPARAWHESIKDPSAFATLTFYAQNKAGKPPVKFDREPVLTYSRPKGKYEGEKADKILFDFWIKNAELADSGFKVRYQLDKETPKVMSTWNPSYFENLTSGKHKLIVDLIDKKGNPVQGAYNHTEREFEVEKMASAKPEASPAGESPAPAKPAAKMKKTSK